MTEGGGSKIDHGWGAGDEVYARLGRMIDQWWAVSTNPERLAHYRYRFGGPKVLTHTATSASNAEPPDDGRTL